MDDWDESGLLVQYNVSLVDQKDVNVELNVLTFTVIIGIWIVIEKKSFWIFFSVPQWNDVTL